MASTCGRLNGSFSQTMAMTRANTALVSRNAAAGAMAPPLHTHRMRRYDATEATAIGKAAGAGWTRLRHESAPECRAHSMALAGVPFLTGYEGSHPSTVESTYPDFLIGVQMAGALLAAIHERRLSGKGQYIDVSMVETIMATR